MAPRIRVPHLVILIPGIMGSVLQRDGRDLWALSGQAISKVLRRAGETIEHLRLDGDDVGREILDDGIVATRLIEQIYDVPQLIKGSGYSTIQSKLLATFDLKPGDVADPQPHQNFFPFPYDWRRDIRAAAGRLDRFVAAQLPRWRTFSNAHNARVILIAHSMGGLVSRYYVEQLGGHQHVEALYTLGTPHRGAPSAINAISNGLWLQAGPLEFELRALTDVLRTFNSIYQLLPIYQCISRDQQIHRVSELSDIPNINQVRAIAARDVLVAIGEVALARRRTDTMAPTLPIIGFGQDTLQSAFFQEDGTLALSYQPIGGVAVADGDGTVPHFSAVPVEVQELNLDTEQFSAQHHGWLPNGDHTLGVLLSSLIYRLGRAKFPTKGNSDQAQRKLGVRVDDLFVVGEPITITVSTQNTPEELLPPIARIMQVDGAVHKRVALQRVQDGWSVAVDELPSGLYQLEVRPQAKTSLGPHPVFTAFEIA